MRRPSRGTATRANAFSGGAWTWGLQVGDRRLEAATSRSESTRQVMIRAPVYFIAVAQREGVVAWAKEVHPSKATLRVSLGTKAKMDLCACMPTEGS